MSDRFMGGFDDEYQWEPDQCDQCQNADETVEWHDLPSEGPGEGVMLCSYCWESAQPIMLRGEVVGEG